MKWKNGHFWTTDEWFGRLNFRITSKHKVTIQKQTKTGVISNKVGSIGNSQETSCRNNQRSEKAKWVKE